MPSKHETKRVSPETIASAHDRVPHQGTDAPETIASAHDRVKHYTKDSK